MRLFLWDEVSMVSGRLVGTSDSGTANVGESLCVASLVNAGDELTTASAASQSRL